MKIIARWVDVTRYMNSKHRTYMRDMNTFKKEDDWV